HHIRSFRKNHAPAGKDYQIVQKASRFVNSIDKALKDKVLGPTINQLNILSLLRLEAIQEGLDEEDLDPEIMTDLLEIAHDFYQAKTKEGRRAFELLPEDIKAKCRSIVKELGGNPNRLEEDLEKTAMALLKVAGLELSLQEVEEMFSEVPKNMNLSQ
ncbi:MAG: hypothetical protein ACM3JI_00130, partial [Anaerolineae bacterium]